MYLHILHTNEAKIAQNPTIQDILEAIVDFSQSVDERFFEITKGFTAVRAEMKQGFVEVAKEFTAVRTEMKQGFVEVAKEFTAVRTEMSQGFADINTEIHQILEKIEQVESRLENVKTQSIGDSNVYGKDIVTLQKEIKILKQRVVKLEALNP